LISSFANLTGSIQEVNTYSYDFPDQCTAKGLQVLSSLGAVSKYRQIARQFTVDHFFLKNCFFVRRAKDPTHFFPAPNNTAISESLPVQGR
jgi:hypothetical protein